MFRRTTKVVFSRTLARAGDGDFVISDDVAAQVGALKAHGDGYFALVCGPDLLGTLTALGLADEYCLLVKPTVQGPGTPLFGAVQHKQCCRSLNRDQVLPNERAQWDRETSCPRGQSSPSTDG